jgi:hypothetical protein
MSRWAPCSRLVFVRRLRHLGFEGPYSGTRHQFMVYDGHRMTIPSNTEFSVPQLRVLLGEIERIIARPISAEEWNRL